MYKRIRTISLSIVLLTSTSSFAQEIFTLERCKELALKNNRQIQNSKLDLEMAKQTQKEVFTHYFPSIDFAGMGFKAKDPMLSVNPAEMLPAELLAGMPPMEIPPAGFLENGMAGAITVTQPIFAGGKIIYGNKLAKLGVEVSKQQSRLSDNEVLLNTEKLYWQLVSLFEKGRTLDILENQLNTLLKEVQVAYDAGLITLNDVLRVKLKLNELKSAKVDLDNGTTLVKMSICQKIGFESYANFNIQQPDIHNVVSPVDIYTDHHEALANRAEVMLLDKSVEAGKIQTTLKRADYMPTIAIGATYYKQDFMNNWNGNGLLFVSVKVPLSGWWGGSHAVKRQKLNEQIILNNKLEGQEQLLLQMQQVKNELNNAYKQIRIAQESIEQASENLRLNNDFYKVGTVTLSDVLDAQSLLQQSRDSYVDVYSEYQHKRFEYLLVTGR